MLLGFSRAEAVCQPFNAVTVVTTDRLVWLLELGGAFMLPFPFPAPMGAAAVTAAAGPMRVHEPPLPVQP